MKPYCYNKRVRRPKTRCPNLTSVQMAAQVVLWRRALSVKSFQEENGKENHSTLPSLLHSLLKSSWKQKSFTFQNEDKRWFHILGNGAWKWSLQTVTGKKSIIPIFWTLCLLTPLFTMLKMHLKQQRLNTWHKISFSESRLQTMRGKLGRLHCPGDSEKVVLECGVPSKQVCLFSFGRRTFPFV